MDNTTTDQTTDDPTNQPSDGSAGGLEFPSDIHVIDHWVKFSSFEYSRENRTAQPNQLPYKHHIVLPVPPNLTTGYNAQYDNEALGFVGNVASRFGASARDAVTRGLNNDTTVTKKFIDSLKGKKELGVKHILDEAGGAAVAAGLDSFGAFGSGLQQGAGVARNPHLAVLYKGTQFREHEFVYKFSPRNYQESEVLREIIFVFKEAMAPEFPEGSENYLFEYPDEWEITFRYGGGHGNPGGLFDIGPSVLTDFNISYHGQGVPSYFRGSKMPSEIDISLKFRETNIITKKDIQESNR